MGGFEIEQKYRIKDPAAVRIHLKKLGARKIHGGSETNDFFDRRGALSKRKMALRLRRFGKTTILTLKGPRLRSRFTKRTELEAPVDYAPFKKILRLSGFRMIRRYRKIRELYRCRKALVTLDRLRGFGWFLEIEGPPGAIAGLEEKLGLGKTDREKRSYLQMLFNWKS